MPRVSGEHRVDCPHCGVAFAASYRWHDQGLQDPDGWRLTDTYHCLNCRRLILYLVNGRPTASHPGHGVIEVDEEARRLLYPRHSSRPVPLEVPEWYRDQYLKATLVLTDAPEASAALSRRCLQRLLREHASATGRTLAAEIDSVLDGDTLPSYVAETLDEVREVGNFGTHPIKSEHSGEVIEVGPGEAEANLAALDGLFDHFFVRPAVRAAQREALNQKLREAGKPEL